MTCGLRLTSSNRLSRAFNTDLSSNVVVHLVIVHLVDWKGEYQRHASGQGELSKLTCQLTLSSRKGCVMRRQTRESNSLVQVLRCSGTSLLDPGSSSLSDPLVQSKSGLYVIGEVIFPREYDAKCCSVFDGLAGTLGLVWLFEHKVSALRNLFGERIDGFNSPSSGAQHHREDTLYPCASTHTAGERTTSMACGRRSS